MYPTFCRFPASLYDDPPLAAVATEAGMGSWRPGLALDAADEQQVRVLVAPSGATLLLPVARIVLGLSTEAALAMMDSVEEAIEDAIESDNRELAARLEAALTLLERTIDDDSG